jgi:hypothetical protein
MMMWHIVWSKKNWWSKVVEKYLFSNENFPDSLIWRRLTLQKSIQPKCSRVRSALGHITTVLTYLWHWNQHNQRKTDEINQSNAKTTEINHNQLKQLKLNKSTKTSFELIENSQHQFPLTSIGPEFRGSYWSKTRRNIYLWHSILENHPQCKTKKVNQFQCQESQYGWKLANLI